METQPPIDYYGLVEAFSKPGCAICNVVLRSGDRFLDSLLCEQVNESESQRAVRARRGLCNEHAWQLTRYLGNAVGIAILYRAVTDEALKVIEKTMTRNIAQSGLARLLGARHEQDASPLADALQPTEPCMVCKVMAGAEQRCLLTLSQYSADEHLLAAFRASNGLCLPHFRTALRQMGDPDGLTALIQTQTDIWTKLKSELQEFIDKNDYRRMREPMGAESDSGLRALRALAGEKGVFGVECRGRDRQ